jgi:serine/threonine protein kinase
LDADSWQRVQDLFERASGLGADDRDALLRLECARDPAMRREVESLLAFSRDDSTFIENAIADAAVSIREAQMGAGGRIGPYRVLRELARGGAGVVYLAERADDAFRLEVAIKLAPIGMYDEQSLRRFRSERQILASFDHPNIARLIDGGTTTDGVPYLVMEYIAGEPIDEYSDSHRLTVAERTELVRAVCAAVEYAHGNGVIHRDIKPGNIQVTGARVPKLLDFGIAKLLDPDQMPHTIARTRTGLRLMTPDYASPEQAWGDPVTRVTDV